MDPEKTAIKALAKAQSILARYVEPGARDCEQTINQLMEVLDDEALVQVVQDSEKDIDPGPPA